MWFIERFVVLFIQGSTKHDIILHEVIFIKKWL